MRNVHNNFLWSAAIVVTAAAGYSWHLLFVPPPNEPALVSSSPPAPEFSTSLGHRNPYSLWSHSSIARNTMNRDNWRDCLASLQPETEDVETVAWSLWQTALYHAGMHGGRIAVEELLASDRAAGGTFAQSSEVFAGWAVTDPEAAWEWLADSDDARLRSALLPRFAPGVAEVPEEMVIQQFAELPWEQKTAQAAAVMRDLLEAGGYDAADSLLDREGAAADGDPAAEVRLQTLFDTVAAQRVHAMKNGGSVEEAADWMASQTDRAFAREEHFAIIASELETRQGPGAAASWLASLVSDDAAEPVKSALLANIQQWIARDPAAAGLWIKMQQDHPACEALISQINEAQIKTGSKAVRAEP